MTRYMVRYYHMDGGENLESVVSSEALESFIKVLLLTGYRIISIE